MVNKHAVELSEQDIRDIEFALWYSIEGHCCLDDNAARDNGTAEAADRRLKLARKMKVHSAI